MAITDGISTWCHMNAHETCTYDECECECHGEGGVREPRNPVPDPPELVMVVT